MWENDSVFWYQWQCRWCLLWYDPFNRRGYE